LHPSVVGLHPGKQTWFSAADREMQVETFLSQDEGADGARRGPADDLSGSGGRAAGGLASYGLYQRETSLEMRQVFMAGPDDE
jgi:hypothetical protein